jgi:hypothetical protein
MDVHEYQAKELPSGMPQTRMLIACPEKRLLPCRSF